MPDRCKNHDCPKCGVRMTNRECLTCKTNKGNPMRVRFCAYCDGGPIIIGANDPQRVEEIRKEFEEVGKKMRGDPDVKVEKIQERD